MNYISTGDFEFTKAMKRNISKVYDSNRLSYGEMSREFEIRWSKLHNCEYGVLSNSGTSSLLVALQALKEIHHWQDSDEVLVPSVTFVATVNIVIQAGLKPVLVDVDPDTYNLDPDLIDAAFTTKTRAIIPVHLFGKSAELIRIKRRLNILSDRKIWVLTDSCEAVLHPADLADITCYSFYSAHHLVCGVGGMSITDTPRYAAKMRSLVNHGLMYKELSTSMEVVDYNPVMLSRKFEFDTIGHSFRITELEAALGLAQLDNLKISVAHRRANARYLIDNLAPFAEKEMIKLPIDDENHSWMMFPILILTEGSGGIREHLTENGVGNRTMMPLTNQPCYEGLWNPRQYPIADFINERGFYVGCHQHLNHKDLDRIVELISEYFNKRWL